MSKVHSGSAVPRHFVFVLEDGTFVVQWDETRIQELLTGNYKYFDENDFGHQINDYELNQLKAAGRVEDYNRNYIWLYALPERQRFTNIKTQERSGNRVRSYYINTTLPTNDLPVIESKLAEIGLADEFTAFGKGNLIAVMGKEQVPFSQLRDAENAQKKLLSRAPDLFEHSAVAFIEITRLEAEAAPASESVLEVSDLATLIASQTDTSITQDKRVVLAGLNAPEYSQIHSLLKDMKLDTRKVESAADAIKILEDCDPNLLVMGLQLSDMHGWEMLGKIKEVDFLRTLPVVVIAPSSATSNDQAFALTVAKVDVYLTLPVSMSRLRQSLWMTLKAHHIEPLDEPQSGVHDELTQDPLASLSDASSDDLHDETQNDEQDTLDTETA
jgi:CheY-like chemotaxis protein